MLRPFPPPNASRLDLLPYQLDSDALTRPVVSAAYLRPPEPSQEYDKSSLSDVSKVSPELLAQLADKAAALAQSSASSVVPKFASDSAELSAGLTRDAKSGDTSDGFILAMIFKIVPIGVNIVAKSNRIVKGLKDTGIGIAQLLTNLAILTTIIGIDTIEFFVQFFIYLFKLLICSVTILLQFPKCVFFYVLDIIMFAMFVLIMSILFIIDVFLFVKSWAGISCIEGFMMLIELVKQLDGAIYSLFSIHIVYYPESILNMCYRCKAMGDTSGFTDVASRMFNHLFVSVPNDIGGPIGDVFNGFANIFSFFDTS